MKVNLRVATLLIAGVQIVMFICLYALLGRVNKLESSHNEDGHNKEKFVFKKEQE